MKLWRVAETSNKNFLKIIGGLYDEVAQLRLSVRANDRYLPELSVHECVCVWVGVCPYD